MSVSVSPCHLSGNGRRVSARITQSVTLMESSPLRVVMTSPVTPSQSPRVSLVNCSKRGVTSAGGEELDAPRRVGELPEGELALASSQHQATGHGDDLARLHARLQVPVGLVQARRGGVALEAVGDGSVVGQQGSRSRPGLGGFIGGVVPATAQPARSAPDRPNRFPRHPAPATLRLTVMRDAATPSRCVAASRSLVVASVVAYNWWVAVVLTPGMVTSTDGFFSDLDAQGQPHAALLRSADVTAGSLLLVALVLWRLAHPDVEHRELHWLLGFATAGLAGGLFPYACSEGFSRACRNQEAAFALPLHHYVHIVAGITEFATATTAIYQGRRRDPEQVTASGRWAHVLGRVLVVAYPLLAVVYLTDRGGLFVEPVFFVAFSSYVLVWLWEDPDGQPKLAAAHHDGRPDLLGRS